MLCHLDDGVLPNKPGKALLGYGAGGPVAFGIPDEAPMGGPLMEVGRPKPRRVVYWCPTDTPSSVFGGIEEVVGELASSSWGTAPDGGERLGAVQDIIVDFECRSHRSCHCGAMGDW